MGVLLCTGWSKKAIFMSVKRLNVKEKHFKATCIINETCFVD